jgi:hypothetical protein
LRRVASQLRPGGVILVNFQFPLARLRPIAITAARAAGIVCGSDWRMEPGDRVGFMRRGAELFYSYGHAFTSDEFERESAQADLRVAHREFPDDFAVYVLEPSSR